MSRRWDFWMVALPLALTGCQAPRPEGAVVDQQRSMEFLLPGLRPREILFPKYLFLDDFEIDQHGRVPGSTLVGAGFHAKLGLADARGRFLDALEANGWAIGPLELERQAFRLVATRKAGTVEIRGVRGSGETRVFLFYEPDPAEVKTVF